MLRIVILAILTTLVLATTVYGRDVMGEFAQYTDHERKWLRDQKIPNTNDRCCSEADGTKAQEDMKDGQYLVSFTACKYPYDEDTETQSVDPECRETGWIVVPAAAVIKGPNEFGRPVVWWYGELNAIQVRCFIPGGGF